MSTRWPVGSGARRALGGDAAASSVGGDSAGGNLAAVTALMARDRHSLPIAAQLLIYPVIAADFDNESYRLFGKGFYNPKPALQWYWDQYVPALADREHPYASPLRANLAGCRPPSSSPPAMIHFVMRASPTPTRSRPRALSRARARSAGAFTGS